METDVRTDTTDCSRPTRSIIIRPHHRRGLLVHMSHVPWSVLGARMDCAKTEEPIVSQFGRIGDSCRSKEPCTRCRCTLLYKVYNELKDPCLAAMWSYVELL